MVRQRGLTMIGFLFVAAVVLVLALLSFRVIPAYIEYFSVQKALEGALNDSKDLSKAEVFAGWWNAASAPTTSIR